MPDPVLAARIRNREFLVAPGVFDLISARLADRMGFAALYVTGYGTVASHLGLPDAGIATYTDMLGRIAQIVKRTQTPVIADADTGYGGLLNVAHTVQGYETAGVSAMQIEDQVFPKRCGHTPGREVIPTAEMEAKIRVAVETRQSSDFLVIARTDARDPLGLDEAIARGQAYAAAGADVIFVEAPRSVDEMRAITTAIDVPLLANLVEGGSTPIFDTATLREIGYSLSIHPCTSFLAAASAMQAAYEGLLEAGKTHETTELYDFSAFSSLMGFQEVWDFAERFSD